LVPLRLYKVGARLAGFGDLGETGAWGRCSQAPEDRGVQQLTAFVDPVRASRHFLMPFKEYSFECLASDMEVLSFMRHLMKPVITCACI
jgi:hypothetical protein